MTDRNRIKPRYNTDSGNSGASKYDELSIRRQQKDAPKTDDGWRDALAKTKSKGYKSNAANVLMIFENDPVWKGKLGYNKRSLCVLWMQKSKVCESKTGDILEEKHAAKAVMWLSIVYGISVSVKMAFETMITVSHNKEFDPLQQWIEKLKWDGVERLDRWLPDATGCETTNYAITVGAKWLISAIARATKPGCKVDTMLILRGPQGTLKSTLLSMLGGEFFTDQIGEVGTKDTLMQIHGPWIIEMSELDAMTRREETTVKSFLTAQVDRFRPPYGRVIEAFPRRCVFAGTTNKDVFLKDETGGRRFWPIKIEEINLKYIEQNREQLFAEAAHRLNSGESWWLPMEAMKEAVQEQDNVRQVDPWEEQIAEIVANKLYFVTVAEVLKDLEVDTTHRHRGNAMRVGFAMKNLGWKRKRKRVRGVQTYCYEPPDHQAEDKKEPADEQPNTEPKQARIEY